jgi:hypothetical protein
MKTSATKKNSPRIHEGYARMSKETTTAIRKTPGSPVPASAPASVLKEVPNKKHLKDANVAVANEHSNDYNGIKDDGIVMRGHGAAVRGIKSRGPMA